MLNDIFNKWRIEDYSIGCTVHHENANFLGVDNFGNNASRCFKTGNMYGS